MLYSYACIPCYNEGTKIKEFVKKTLKYVDAVIVCNDGSTDDTIEQASMAGAIVISHEKNLGKGAALKTLFNFSKNSNADVIITIDGDGQFLPEEIPKLIKSLVENKSDIVIGYRFDDTTEMPTYRKFGNKILDKMTNLASDLPFRDTQSGFRVYSKSAIDKIEFSTSGFGADSEILVDASHKDLKISEEKVTVLYNTHTKTSTKNPISHSTEVIMSILELIALKRPLTLIGIPGIVMIVIGITYSIVSVSLFNETRYFSIPSTLVAMGSLLAGIMMFLMSVLLFSITKLNKYR